MIDDFQYVNGSHLFDISIIFIANIISLQFDTPTTTVLYTIEEAIKAYRKFCQDNLNQVSQNITVDQLLVLLILNRYPDLNQKEIAELVFKDYASITRIIELLVKKGYILRKIHPDDRRRFKLTLTKAGQNNLQKLTPVIENNRATALNNISINEMVQLQNTLKKIISNCKNT